MDRGNEPPAPRGFHQFPGVGLDGEGQSWFVIGTDALLGHFRRVGANIKPFSPEPYYEPEGDSLIFYAKDVPSHAKRVNSLLTVFLAIEGDNLIGCEIKGVRRILGLVRRFGVGVIDRKAKLGMFFAFALATPSDDESPADDYEKQFEQFKDVEVDTSELVAV